MKKLLLIDGSSLLHRAFYALPLLSNKDGIFTNAVHGFMMMFNRLVEQQKPDYIMVAFDKSRVTFRNQIDPDYKGNRSETPVELKGQFELIKEVLDAAHIHWQEIEGYEADDILGTFSRRGTESGFTVEIFSGDRDVFQLIDENTVVFMTKKGISDIERYDIAAIQQRYGVLPSQLIEIKGLMGDSSDNIPGVPGVGEKTAIKLISQYGTIDNLYSHLDELKGKIVEKLAENRDSAYRSRELATICCNMDLPINWEEYSYDPHADNTPLAEIYRRLGMNQLLRGLSERGTKMGKGDKPFSQEQPLSPLEDEELPWDTEADSSSDRVADNADNSSAPTVGLIDVLELVAKIQKSGSFALYAQWLHPVISGKFTEIGIAIPGEPGVLVAPECLEALRGVLEDKHITKQVAHSKELRLLLLAHDIDIAGITDDIILAAYLLDPAAGSYEIGTIAPQYGFSIAAQASAGDYAQLIPALAEELRKRLSDQEMMKLYLDMELPLAAVLADMEKEGVRVEGDKLADMSQALAKAIDDCQADIYAIAGHEFNLNSPKQLGTVLFDELGIPPIKKTKTGYSTDAEVLETLAGQWQIAARILDYRLVSKLRSTYTDGLRPLINSQTGKIHTTYMQTVTATGRLSSVEPNLQNIPVRHELGRRIREVFVADCPEDMLISADYNQIELRVLAHISGDAKLIEAFRKGEDIHSRTASEVLGIAPEDITPFQRRQAKAVNFGIVYGISDYGLSRDLGISRAEAADYIARYFQRYPGVADYQRQTILEARTKGYVSTLCGRRRYLPDLLNRNYNLRSLAERMAINTPIQGSAADIIKIAMIEIANELKLNSWHSKMILQVHDELIFNVIPKEQKELIYLIKDKMEHALPLAVPLTVDIKAGKNWYDMEKVR